MDGEKFNNVPMVMPKFPFELWLMLNTQNGVMKKETCNEDIFLP